MSRLNENDLQFLYDMENLKENNLEIIAYPLGRTFEIVWRCKGCGKIHSSDFSNIYRKGLKRLCKVCGKLSNQYDITYAKKIFKEQEYILLEDNYINCKTKMKYYCPKCKKEHSMSLDNMKRGKSCPTCGIEKLKLKDEDIIKKCESLGFKVLNINKQGNITITLQCGENHKFEVTWRYIRDKEVYTCMVCRNYKDSKKGKSQAMYESEIKEYLIKENLPYTLINIYNKYYNDRKSIWLTLKCKMHGNFEVEKNSLMGKIVQRCPICTGNASKGEARISEILNKHDINFIREHSFGDCRNIYPLPFDFYLPENEIFIEFQGNEHYESIKFFGGDEKFKQRQINDKIKREYCKDKKLIEIPYWEFDNIEEILTKELNLQNEAVVK